MRQIFMPVFCLMLLLSTSVAFAAGQDNNTQSNVLHKAAQQLQAGNAQAAYNTLLPWVDKLAGHPDFDNLFGHAALAADADTRAIMAFERCVAVQPANGSCRLGLVRAHMQLDEKQAAHDELVSIQKSSPPPEVEKAVEHYLGKLAGNAPAHHYVSGWIQAGLGYDNNTNVAPSSSSIILPGSSIFPGATYSSSTDGSGFGQGRLNLGLRYPSSQHWNLLAGLDGHYQKNFQVADNSFFDKVTQMGVHLGASAHYGRQQVGLMLRGGKYYLHGDSYRKLAGVTAQYGYLVSAESRLSAFLQYARFSHNYSSKANLQDVDTIMGGVSWVQRLKGDQLLAFAGIYAGSDSKVKSAAPDNIESDYQGLRVGATWLFAKHWKTGVKLLGENRQYGGKAPLVGKQRKDHRFSGDLNLSWQFARDLSLRAAFTYINDDSNIKIRDHDRQITTLGVRYDFL